MAKRRRNGSFSLKEDRQLIQMAAASATLEEAGAILRTSVETIERKAERLGIKLKGKRPSLLGQTGGGLLLVSDYFSTSRPLF
jgi:hypothetical protein